MKPFSLYSKALKAASKSVGQGAATAEPAQKLKIDDEPTGFEGPVDVIHHKHVPPLNIHGGIGHYQDVTEKKPLKEGFDAVDALDNEKPSDLPVNDNPGYGHKYQKVILQPHPDPKDMEGMSDFVKNLPTREFHHKGYYGEPNVDEFHNDFKQNEDLHKKHEILPEYSNHTTPDSAPAMSLKRAVNLYTGTGYADLNNDLYHGRKHRDQTTQEIDDRLAHHFKHTAIPLDRQMVVHAGLKPPAANTLEKRLHETDGVINVPAYLSTSLRPTIANSFADGGAISKRKNPDVDERHHLRIHLPAGYKQGHYIEPHTDNMGEFEYLLNKGQKFKIVGHDIHKGFAKKDMDDEDMNDHRSTIHVWHAIPHEE